MDSCDPRTKWGATRRSNDRRRVFDVPSAPVFYPSHAEWEQSPLKYIESIRAQGEEWGVVKIVPPRGWNPGFHIDQKTFKFETRIQKLNSIDGCSRPTVNYLDQLELFHEQSGSSFTRAPLLDGNPLDLWILRKEVIKRGDDVESVDWRKVAQSLGAKSDAAHNSVRVAYMKWIHPYEQFVRANLKHILDTALPTADKHQNESEESEADDCDSTSSSSLVRKRKSQKHQIQRQKQQQQTMKPKMLGMGRMITSSGRMMKRISGNNEDVDAVAKAAISGNCQVCGDGRGTGYLLKCDECKHRFHARCLDPPLTLATLPTSADWYCALCLKTHGDDFGFQQQGSLHSLSEFQVIADSFKRDYFLEKRAKDKHNRSKDYTSDSMRHGSNLVIEEEEMELEFWKLVEEDRFNDGVEVQYGADLHSSEHGSGFPNVKTDPTNPYAHSGWNLNNIPVVPESLFCNIRNDISGMMVPWLYVGMAFSAFCWHTEDHYTYSINYNHFGDTKTWYGIPASDSVKFEVLMKRKVPELFETNPDLLFHLTTLLSPRHLVENRVKVCSVDQRAGEFVVTFPRAYHAGFNQGLNLAEAVNFALPNWLPYGLSCADRYIRFHKQPVFSHEELVVATALKDNSIKTCLWLKPELEILCDRELAGRSAIRNAYGPYLTEIEETVTLTSSQDIFCAVCRAYCFLTSVELACSSSNNNSNGIELTGTSVSKTTPPPQHANNTFKVVCYRHVAQLKSHCECEPVHLIMRIRYPDTQLVSLRDRVISVADAPKSWLKAYQKLLCQQSRPRLSDLEALLADAARLGMGVSVDGNGGGEELGYVLEESITLKGFLDAAHDWVQRAETVLLHTSVRAPLVLQPVVSGNWDEFNVPLNALQPHLSPQYCTIHVVDSLLREVDNLPFDCPEIDQLQKLLEKSLAIHDRFRDALSEPLSLKFLEKLLNDFDTERRDIGLIIESALWLQEARQDCLWIQAAKKMMQNSQSSCDQATSLLKRAQLAVESSLCEKLVPQLAGLKKVKDTKKELCSQLERFLVNGSSRT
ncbi:hypothetical protein HDU78_010047 [Chytriomyces hyalinus]|nr:hypothetical protein HDU78_010047 [Chytriomyces hyalinus]